MKLTCVCLLALCVLALPRANAVAQSAATAKPGDITVVTSARRVLLTKAELASLPRRQTQLKGDNGDTAIVSGVSLWDVLQKAGVPPNEASGRQRAVMVVRLTGADGQDAALALVEIDPSFSSRQALIVDQRGGKPLDDVEGPWRVVFPDDLRHARWIRGLVSITIETFK